MGVFGGEESRWSSTASTGESLTEEEMILALEESGNVVNPSEEEMITALETLNYLVQPTYALTYFANGGTGSPPTDESRYLEGETAVTYGPGDLTLEGYNWTSWNTSVEGTGSSYGIEESITFEAEDINLYAQWEEPEEPPEDPISEDFEDANIVAAYTLTAGTSIAVPSDEQAFGGLNSMKLDHSVGGGGNSESMLESTGTWDNFSLSFWYRSMPNLAADGARVASIITQDWELENIGWYHPIVALHDDSALNDYTPSRNLKIRTTGTGWGSLGFVAEVVIPSEPAWYKITMDYVRGAVCIVDIFNVSNELILEAVVPTRDTPVIMKRVGQTPATLGAGCVSYIDSLYDSSIV